MFTEKDFHKGQNVCLVVIFGKYIKKIEGTVDVVKPYQLEIITKIPIFRWYVSYSQIQSMGELV